MRLVAIYLMIGLAYSSILSCLPNPCPKAPPAHTDAGRLLWLPIWPLFAIVTIVVGQDDLCKKAYP